MNNPTDTQSPAGNSSNPPTTQPSGQFRIGLVGICSIVVCILFFCPWIAFIGFTVSGFEMVKNGGSGLIFLSIPFAALFAIIADLTGNQVKTLGAVAGIIPLLLFAYYYTQTGKDIWSILQPGGYGILAFSSALLIVSAVSPTKKTTVITFP